LLWLDITIKEKKKCGCQTMGREIIIIFFWGDIK
jgi:hypothetical protein